MDGASSAAALRNPWGLNSHSRRGYLACSAVRNPRNTVNRLRRGFRGPSGTRHLPARQNTGAHPLRSCSDAASRDRPASAKRQKAGASTTLTGSDATSREDRIALLWTTRPRRNADDEAESELSVVRPGKPSRRGGPFSAADVSRDALSPGARSRFRAGRNALICRPGASSNVPAAVTLGVPLA